MAPINHKRLILLSAAAAVCVVIVLAIHHDAVMLLAEPSVRTIHRRDMGIQHSPNGVHCLRLLTTDRGALGMGRLWVHRESDHGVAVLATGYVPTGVRSDYIEWISENTIRIKFIDRRGRPAPVIIELPDV